MCRWPCSWTYTQVYPCTRCDSDCFRSGSGESIHLNAGDLRPRKPQSSHAPCRSDTAGSDSAGGSVAARLQAARDGATARLRGLRGVARLRGCGVRVGIVGNDSEPITGFGSSVSEARVAARRVADCSQSRFDLTRFWLILLVLWPVF